MPLRCPARPARSAPPPCPRYVSPHPLVDALCACARDPLPTIAAAAADGLEAAGAARGGGGGALGEMIRESFERELGAPRLIAEIESTSYLL